MKIAQTPQERIRASRLGFPKFKSSKGPRQSFNWNNQGYAIIDTDNNRFKILKIMKQNFKIR